MTSTALSLNARASPAPRVHLEHRPKRAAVEFTSVHVHYAQRTQNLGIRHLIGRPSAQECGHECRLAFKLLHNVLAPTLPHDLGHAAAIQLVPLSSDQAR